MQVQSFSQLFNEFSDKSTFIVCGAEKIPMELQNPLLSKSKRKAWEEEPREEAKSPDIAKSHVQPGPVQKEGTPIRPGPKSIEVEIGEQKRGRVMCTYF